MFRSAIRTGLSCPEILIGVPGWFNKFLMTVGTLFDVQSFFNVEFHIGVQYSHNFGRLARLRTVNGNL